MMERYTMRMLRRCFCTLDPKRLQYIRNHTPMTEYERLNPTVTEHVLNRVRIVEDQETKLRFLTEEGGFPGCSDVGICMKVGTQDETPENAGSLQYLKNFVHMKPTFEQLVNNYEFLHQTGSSFDFNYDAITSYAKCSFFEEDENIMIDLLLDLALQEKNMFEDNFQTEADLSNIVELVRRTAFGGKGLGMPSTGMGNVLTNKEFLKFQQKITPHNMLISISNITDVDRTIKRIIEKIKIKYPSFLKRSPPPKTVSQYTGGFNAYNSEQEFFQFAIAFPSVPLKSQNMELFNILRILLGSASAFSSGGPGKGMHSRCTKYLLNRVACVEKASYINEHFEEHGLFGLTVGGPHQTAMDVIECTLKQLKRLKYEIPAEELNRAKNILISSIYTNIERQPDRLEEMSKHIFSYGRVRLLEFEAKIRQVTSQQIKDFIEKILREKPTLVYSGNEESLKIAPSQSKLQRLVQQILHK